MNYRISNNLDLKQLRQIKSAYELETGSQVSVKPIDKYIIWLAEENSRIISAVFFDIVDDFAQIPIVYTLPEYRNQGLGTRLFQFAINWAKSQPIKYLVLWPTPKSRSFYSRLGFKPELLSSSSPFKLQL